MDKELKAKWVEALRSGKYQQGYGVNDRPSLLSSTTQATPTVADPSHHHSPPGE